MAGTWIKQDKILPGAYINVRTNVPLSITPGERGTVVILQELSVGDAGDIYTVTATENNFPEGATAEDKKLAFEALLNAKIVLVYKLPDQHDTDGVNAALKALKAQRFNSICYPYDTVPATASANKTAIASWIKTQRTEEDINAQAVLANHAADSEAVINVVQGIVLADGSKLTAEEVTAWVAGATAGASITKSNTLQRYEGAIDVVPRMTKSEMENAIKAGEFIFKVDRSQNVTVVYDINSLTTLTPEKGKIFKKNRVIRTLDGIRDDITEIFESSYIGKINNSRDGRAILKAALVDYFSALQTKGAIENFDVDDVIVSEGDDADAVVIDAALQPLDSAEKIYITVDLS